MKTMKATVFQGANDIRVEEVSRPQAGIGEAVIRVTLTTICGTDLHIVRGVYPVKPGLIIGHEPVGVMEELGPVAVKPQATKTEVLSLAKSGWPPCHITARECTDAGQSGEGNVLRMKKAKWPGNTGRIVGMTTARYRAPAISTTQ